MRPRFEDIILSLRGLLESANNRHKLQTTLTGGLPAPSSSLPLFCASQYPENWVHPHSVSILLLTLLLLQSAETRTSLKVLTHPLLLPFQTSAHPHSVAFALETCTTCQRSYWRCHTHSGPSLWYIVINHWQYIGYKHTSTSGAVLLSPPLCLSPNSTSIYTRQRVVWYTS